MFLEIVDQVKLPNEEQNNISLTEDQVIRVLRSVIKNSKSITPIQKNLLSLLRLEYVDENGVKYSVPESKNLNSFLRNLKEEKQNAIRKEVKEVKPSIFNI